MCTPEAILVLGGSEAREHYAAEFARTRPELTIWVSSGSPEAYALHHVFDRAQIDRDRLHLDYRATDTVTNFTSLADDLKAEGITSVYLVTSDYHMRRARAIGEIVLGSRGISYKPLAVPSDRPPEAWIKVVRDGARALLWVTTGHTGASLSDLIHPELKS